MKSIFHKVFKAAIFVMAFTILAGCTHDGPWLSGANAKDVEKRSAWIAYWDLDEGEKDLKKVSQKIDQLVYFCAYFDKDDNIFIPPGLSERKNKLEKEKMRYETYLSFVNDKQNADKSVVVKDIEVLRRIFADDSSMERHIDEIIALALKEGFDGIEIDYERIWKDEEIGRSFLQFSDKLYQKAQENNLKMRIVLEPGTPFASHGADFCEGPEYSVMFYNLYGLHSGPGPKADKEFIQKTIKKMASLPGEKSVAFSTGGCLWGDNGVKRFITEAQAKGLAKTYKAKQIRDNESQCQIFSYKDKEGVSYTVWYADIKTLNYWILAAKEQGFKNIDLWRLGGNENLNKIN